MSDIYLVYLPIVHEPENVSDTGEQGKSLYHSATAVRCTSKSWACVPFLRRDSPSKGRHKHTVYIIRFHTLHTLKWMEFYKNLWVWMDCLRSINSSAKGCWIFNYLLLLLLWFCVVLLFKTYQVTHVWEYKTHGNNIYVCTCVRTLWYNCLHGIKRRDICSRIFVTITIHQNHKAL